MKLKIEFFEDDLVGSIGAGIYKIDVSKNGKKEVLYIGESVLSWLDVHIICIV